MVVVVWTIIQSKGRLILLVSETVNQKYLLKLKCVCEGMQKKQASARVLWSWPPEGNWHDKTLKKGRNESLIFMT